VNLAEFLTIIVAGAFFAGLLGSLTGLGGGVVIVPLLTLGLGVDVRYAAGASLLAVIGTSCGAGAVPSRLRFSNLRIGLFLEVAAVAGALSAALAVTHVPVSVLSFLFGGVLLFSAWFSLHPPVASPAATVDRFATLLDLDGRHVEGGVEQDYHVRGVPSGFGLMFVAGVLSGLLGIGSGALKTLAMDQVMRIPFKVSTATSNFMIGLTAAASAGVYISRGYVDPELTLPVVFGTVLGAMFGTHVLGHMRTRVLRPLFALVIVVLGVQMIVRAFTH
jgi:uncharacterized membrane protein YfcA